MGSSQPREWTHVSCVSHTSRQILFHWATWGLPLSFDSSININQELPGITILVKVCCGYSKGRTSSHNYFLSHSRHRVRTGTQVPKSTGSSHLFDSKTEFTLGFSWLESIVMIKAGHPWESEGKFEFCLQRLVQPICGGTAAKAVSVVSIKSNDLLTKSVV